MMRARVVAAMARPPLLVGVGAVAVALVLTIGGPAEPPGSRGDENRPSSAAAESPPRREVVSRAVRNVTPPGVTPGPTVTGPLVRVVPPQSRRSPRPARVQRVYHPIVVSAGVIKAGGRDIELAGVAAPDFDATCGEGAAAWPCGRMARAALRQFIRGRAIECAVPPGADEIPSVGSCSVGGENLSEWLVSKGWARPVGAIYAPLEAPARQARLGLWSDGRPGGQPDARAADAMTGESPGAAASSPASALAIRPRVSGTP
jgi:endonuclease YncB( thermonuclease family)